MTFALKDTGMLRELSFLKKKDLLRLLIGQKLQIFIVKHNSDGTTQLAVEKCQLSQRSKTHVYLYHEEEDFEFDLLLDDFNYTWGLRYR